MDRRQFLKTALTGSTVLSLSCCSKLFAKDISKRPNFLFLFTDDQSFATVSALNNTVVKTPNIDRLVRRGTTFTHCFNQGAWSGAVCVASRAMLNTGRYLWTCGGDDCGDYPLWGEVMSQAGYDTFVTGKWHNRQKALERSFKTIGPTGGGMFPSEDPDAKENRKKGICKDPYNRPREGNSWSPYDKTLKGHWRKKDGKIVHSSKLWADAAIDYLDNHVTKSSNPFFMYVSFHAPHDPRQSPKKFVDMYPPEKIKIPPNFLPEHHFDQGDHKCRDERLAPFPRTRQAVRTHLSEYHAIITHADYHIGRILAALERTGETDNTIIVFSADHGLAVGQHGLMGKQNQYDHSVRMPFIFCGPGVPKNRKIPALVYLQSTFATTCEMAGIDVPETVQFPSLLPLLKGKKKKLYDSIYGAYRDFQRMVRSRRYKLIRYPQAGEVQLFDLQNDPWETRDLAENPKYFDKLIEMDKLLRWWMQKTSDNMELEPLI